MAHSIHLKDHPLQVNDFHHHTIHIPLFKARRRKQHPAGCKQHTEMKL
jgi:hypothetical protein